MKVTLVKQIMSMWQLSIWHVMGNKLIGTNVAFARFYLFIIVVFLCTCNLSTEWNSQLMSLCHPIESLRYEWREGEEKLWIFRLLTAFLFLLLYLVLKYMLHWHSWGEDKYAGKELRSSSTWTQHIYDHYVRHYVKVKLIDCQMQFKSTVSP